MSQLMTYVVLGLSLGCINCLVAVGFVLVYKATRVVDFAHGAVLLLGVYVIATTTDSLGFGLAVATGVAAGAACSAAVQLLIIRPLRGADLTTLAMATIGVEILLTTELSRRVGTDLLTLDAPWGAETITVAGMTLPVARLIAAALAASLLAAFFAAFRLSDAGIAMRCAAEDRETAALMGVRLGRVGAYSWAVAGALAALAGLFFASFPTPGVEPSVALVALAAAIPAAVVGGLDSITGTVVGGLAIGVVTTLTAGYESELAFLGRGLSAVTPWVVMLLVLLVRPAGLFGTREAARV